jgi:hypothetical protein
MDVYSQHGFLTNAVEALLTPDSRSRIKKFTVMASECYERGHPVYAVFPGLPRAPRSQ